MDYFLQDKRVFKQDSNKERYLFLSKENIKQCYYFYDDILIKKGDLLTPNKWIKYNETVLTPLSSLNIDEYEFIFYPNDHKKELQTIIDSFTDLDLDNKCTELLTLESIPSCYERQLRDILEDAKTEPSQVEVYKYESKDEYIILDPELTDNDISYECTSDFKKLEILSRYKDKDRNLCLVYLGVESSSEFQRNNNWYICEATDKGKLISLTLIYDIEDIIKFTNFKAIDK